MTELDIETGRKRNYSNLSTSSTSPAVNPNKTFRMTSPLSEASSLNAKYDSVTTTIADIEEQENIEEKIKNLTMEEKVTKILFVLKKLTINSALDLKSLQLENKQLKLHQLESDGIIAKLSQNLEKLEEKLTTMEAHSMSKM